MRALVTGGAGFIGSNLVDALLERGDEVTVVDNLATGRESNLERALQRGVRLERLDIRDAERLTALTAETAPDAIFHLAAQIDVRRSLLEPVADAEINIGGTINVLEAARAAGGVRVVNSSTGGAIYGDTEPIPTPEETLPLPEAAYGQSKYAAEGYCALYGRLYGLDTVTLRYGNVYGPRQDPLGEAGVVAIFCGCLGAGNQPTVYGDGTQTRDYVYVGDVVAANLAAATTACAGPINIGTGRESSVLDLIAALAELSGSRFEPQFAPPRLGELRRSSLDVRRAERVLNWRPRTQLRDGLERTLATTTSP